MDDEHYIDGDHNGGVFNHFNHNSYGYCYQNPIILIDPNGKQVYFPGPNTKEFTEKAEKALQFMKDKGTDGIFNELNSLNVPIAILDDTGSGNSRFNRKFNFIRWDPEHGAEIISSGKKLSPVTVLIHELSHALECNKHPFYFLVQLLIYDETFESNMEEKRVNKVEKEVAVKHGEIENEEEGRKTYQDVNTIICPDPTSTEGSKNNNDLDEIIITAPRKNK